MEKTNKMENSYLIILFMALVTYIPRLIPFVFLSGKKIPKKIEQLLNLIPFTALGALIIPGAFNCYEENKSFVFIALSFVFIYSWKKGNIIFSIIGSISILFFLLYFFA